MATTAFTSSPVCAVYDARHRASVAIRVSKIRMTPEAKLSAGIDKQRLNTGRMIYSWPMTVLALDRRMR
jgi:hypothetical protein